MKLRRVVKPRLLWTSWISAAIAKKTAHRHHERHSALEIPMYTTTPRLDLQNYLDRPLSWNLSTYQPPPKCLLVFVSSYVVHDAKSCDGDANFSHRLLPVFAIESVHDVQSKQDLTVCIRGGGTKRRKKNTAMQLVAFIVRLSPLLRGSGNLIWPSPHWMILSSVQSESTDARDCWRGHRVSKFSMSYISMP